MAFKTTILLKKNNTNIDVVGVIGVPIDLTKIGVAIQSLESFLARQPKANNVRCDWEKGELIIPDDEQFRNATAYEKEIWGAHIESEGKKAPPGMADNTYKYEKKLLWQARNLYTQMQRHLKIANILVPKQKEFLLSNNWMDKTRISMPDIAKSFPRGQEKTIERAIHQMSFRMSGKYFPAEALICSSNKPQVCKHIFTVVQKQPQASARIVAEELRDQGIEISQRTIGEELPMIRKFAVLAENRHSTHI